MNDYITHILISMISELEDRVAAIEHFPDNARARRKFIKQLGEINGILAQAEPESAPSDHEDRIAALEEHHAERERDKDRPVHIKIIRPKEVEETK